MGVRLALGATRAQIVRQMLAESVLLALAGGALGFVLAHWVVRGLAALAPAAGQPGHVSFALDVSQDARVFVYAIAAALVIAGLFGLAPARFASRTDVVDALKASGGSGRRPATLRTLTTVVVGQIAVSTALLVIAGLFVRTYLNTLAVEPGIDTRNLLAVSLDVEQIDADAHAGRVLYEDILRRVSALPDVERAGLSRERPLAFSGRDTPVWVDDGAGVGSEAPRDAGTLVVSPEYFDVLGVPILHGRTFGANDGEKMRVAVVNETMARRFWPDGSAVGRLFRTGARTSEPIQVVGVARDVKYRSLTEPPRAVFHQPFAQAYAPQMTLLVRWRAGARDIAAQVEREVHAANPDLAIVHAATVSDQVAAAIAPRRQSAVFLLGVCALGLLLTTVGLYGAMSYGVRRRAREFGIRMALGARARDVLVMVLGQGLRLAVAGLALGIAASLALTRAIAGRLYGVSPYDPATIAVASGVLVVVALAAVYVPALWATRVEAAVSLRDD
jgi:putative ABC transport system permease protein